MKELLQAVLMEQTIHENRFLDRTSLHAGTGMRQFLGFSGQSSMMHPSSRHIVI